MSPYQARQYVDSDILIHLITFPTGSLIGEMLYCGGQGLSLSTVLPSAANRSISRHLRCSQVYNVVVFLLGAVTLGVGSRRITSRCERLDLRAPVP